jgi:hypothetical protein
VLSFFDPGLNAGFIEESLGMTTALNTAKVFDRRKLRFETIGELRAEVDRVVGAERAGTLSLVGNWTVGQIFGHLAAWINYSYDGYPLKPPPWFIRIILRWQVKKYLKHGMPAGVRIPRVENGTLATEPLDTDEGAKRLRAALVRLASDEPARYDSPAFGPMSHADRIQLNLRHAELHLSFLRY